jgi:hypothetical protein
MMLYELVGLLMATFVFLNFNKKELYLRTEQMFDILKIHRNNTN